MMHEQHDLEPSQLPEPDTTEVPAGVDRLC
jgi:hypothetical protein